jgi:hypothetical protein
MCLPELHRRMLPMLICHPMFLRVWATSRPRVS